ncbi:hypothetical protein [Denitratimonas sp. CY0512]|uniref:hypothetical protein n=1 Tax=Denitratimonas sp. CY0512 TaxID=3131940 RepID=UPI0030A9542A
MSGHRLPIRLFLAALLLGLLAACGVGSQQDIRQTTLFNYAGAIRWGHIDDAWSMVDPEYARRHPLSQLDRQRFEQVQITGYRVKGSQMLSEEELVQLVEIRLINRHTQSERVIQDRQLWRWDKESRRWWLTTGLPDIVPGSP